MSNLRLDLVEKKVEVLHRDQQKLEKVIQSMQKEIGELIVEIQQTLLGLSRGTTVAIKAVTTRLDVLEATNGSETDPITETENSNPKETDNAMASTTDSAD